MWRLGVLQFLEIFPWFHFPASRGCCVILYTLITLYTNYVCIQTDIPGQNSYVLQFLRLTSFSYSLAISLRIQIYTS